MKRTSQRKRIIKMFADFTIDKQMCEKLADNLIAQAKKAREQKKAKFKNQK